jgi:hypothetical protein
MYPVIRQQVDLSIRKKEGKQTGLETDELRWKTSRLRIEGKFVPHVDEGRREGYPGFFSGNEGLMWGRDDREELTNGWDVRLATIWYDNILNQAAKVRRCVGNAPYELPGILVIRGNCAVLQARLPPGLIPLSIGICAGITDHFAGAAQVVFARERWIYPSNIKKAQFQAVLELPAPHALDKTMAACRDTQRSVSSASPNGQVRWL